MQKITIFAYHYTYLKKHFETMEQDINAQKDRIRQLLFASFSIDVETAKKMLKRIEDNPNKIPSILNYLNKEITSQYSWVKNTWNDEFKELVESRIAEWLQAFGEISIPEYMQMTKCWDVPVDWYYSLSYTPANIKQMLDCFVIGQENYKMALAVNFYTYLIRKKGTMPRLPKCNLLVCGPSGSGKTYGTQVLSKLFRLPFLVIHCNSLVQEGIIGTSLSGCFTSLALEGWSDEELACSVICFDEFDKLFEKTTKGDDAGYYNARIINELLNIIDDKGEIEFKRDYDYNADRIKISNKKMMFVFTGVFNGMKKANTSNKNTSKARRPIGFNRPMPMNVESSETAPITSDDLIQFGIKPEIVGRIQNFTTVNALTEDDMVRLFNLGISSPFTEFEEYFKYSGIEAVLTEDGMHALARIAIANNLGVRGLKGLLQQALMEDMFDLEVGEDRRLEVNEAYILEQLKGERRD